MQDRVTPEAAGGFNANPLEKTIKKALKLWFHNNPKSLLRKWMIESYFGKKGFNDILDIYGEELSKGNKLNLLDEYVMMDLIDEIITSWEKS